MVQLNCQKCGKIFYTYKAWLRKPNRGKYCSRACTGKSQWKFENGPSYWSVHGWILKNFGKADFCQNPQCLKVSKTYDWALLKGKDYEKNKDNFISLCRSCHKKYDRVKIGLTVRERFLGTA